MNVTAAEILKTSHTLNSKSAELGMLIEQLEEALKQLSLGVEAWVEDVDGDTRAAGILAVGYARLSSGWHLAIRRQSVIRPLSESKRIERVLAAPYLSLILPALVKEAEALSLSLNTAITEVGTLLAQLETGDCK